MANSFPNGVGTMYEADNTYNNNIQNLSTQMNNTYESSSKSILVNYTQSVKVGSADFTDVNIVQNFVFGRWGTTPVLLQSTHAGNNVIQSVIQANSIAQYSDHRIKQNVETLGEEQGVKKIRVVSYNSKSDNSKHFGVIAHELGEIYPELVTDTKDGEAMQSVSYSELIPLCINDIQKLQKENELLRSRLESIEAKLATIQ